jgi:hypothetical protein
MKLKTYANGSHEELVNGDSLGKGWHADRVRGSLANLAQGEVLFEYDIPFADQRACTPRT